MPPNAQRADGPYVALVMAVRAKQTSCPVVVKPYPASKPENESSLGNPELKARIVLTKDCPPFLFSGPPTQGLRGQAGLHRTVSRGWGRLAHTR